MPASTAISNATRLDEIGFTEFTTKLVSDVFDSLIAANIRQQQAYVELLSETSKSLSTYINDTKDDIGPGEILQLLSAALPPENPTADSPPSKVAPSGSLTAADATALNDALEVTGGGIENDNKVASAGAMSQPKYDTILEAAARRVAANKYTLLQEMVRQGMLRLVVEDGTIETRLDFNTYGSDYYSRNSSSTTRNEFSFRASAATGGLISAWVKASASTAYNNIRVSTQNASSGGSTTTSVNISGGVRINFKTDYLPLVPVA